MKIERTNPATPAHNTYPYPAARRCSPNPGRLLSDTRPRGKEPIHAPSTRMIWVLVPATAVRFRWISRPSGVYVSSTTLASSVRSASNHVQESWYVPLREQEAGDRLVAAAARHREQRRAHRIAHVHVEGLAWPGRRPSGRFQNGRRSAGWSADRTRSISISISISPSSVSGLVSSRRATTAADTSSVGVSGRPEVMIHIMARWARRFELSASTSILLSKMS